ncbi:MAG TPA: hypothetical protein VGL16_04150 [Actinomycetota bacterium]|jgi:hypothetical protein
MHFRATYIASELWLRDEQEPLVFDLGGPHHVRVEIRLPTDDELGVGHRREDAFVVATSVLEASQRIMEMFKSLLNNRLPEAPPEPLEWPWSEDIDPEGNITPGFLVPPRFMPQPWQDFTRQSWLELVDVLRRTVLVLRWRTGTEGVHSPFSSKGVEWSFDGEDFHPLSVAGDVFVLSRGNLSVGPEVEDDVRNIVADGGSEPLGHTLYREAWEQRLTNPRSAVVVGMAALEVGFKELVADLVPNARWLVENIQTPPLHRLLGEYLPLLPARLPVNGHAGAPPKSFLNTVRDWTGVRNVVSHSGRARIDLHELEDVLRLVRGFLWLFDYYRGRVWTLEKVPDELRPA